MSSTDFSEYEAFSQHIGEAAISMRITSLEEEKWIIQRANAGSVRMQQGYEGGGSIAEGPTFLDGWVFYHHSCPGHANGRSLTHDEVFAAPPGSEFCLVCHPVHEWLTVFVPTSLLFTSPSGLEISSFARPQLLNPPPQVTRTYTSLVRRFLAVAEARPRVLISPAAVEAFQLDLIRAVSELFLRDQQATDRHSARWLRQAKLAIELAIHDPSMMLSISDLARTSGVPERTLRTAFQRCYGLSPNELLGILRLNQARQLLLANSPDQTTVTRIAFELGFWDLGRFAGTYHQLYGELPSATLRRAARGRRARRPRSIRATRERYVRATGIFCASISR